MKERIMCLSVRDVGKQRYMARYSCEVASYLAARVIVEAGLTNYRVRPQPGTHFFQNLTSFGVGYFTINAFMNDGVYNQES